MSMSYELMMRKKEQIMYATIKGTLTENDGVFSGFSSSNYLVGQTYVSFSDMSSFEYLIKFKLTSSPATNSVLCGGAGIVPYIDANNNIKYYAGTVFNGTVGSHTLTYDTDYWFKFVYDGIDNYTAYLSTDGINWEVDVTKTTSDKLTSAGYIEIGRNTSVNTQYLRGSIDLPNSYIKIGSTKYNLQAVVGYTIVGSPTITDGVVSDMNSSNYLIVPNFPYVSADSWEIVINADTTYNSGQPQQRLLRINNYFQFQVQGVEAKWQFYNGTDLYSIITSEEGLVSTYKFVKMVKSSGASSIQFYVSTDGITWITGNTIAISSSATDGNMSIGASGNGWLGTVNLNNTYIKVNNKLWFNGQQA